MYTYTYAHSWSTACSTSTWNMFLLNCAHAQTMAATVPTPLSNAVKVHNPAACAQAATPAANLAAQTPHNHAARTPFAKRESAVRGTTCRTGFASQISNSNVARVESEYSRMRLYACARTRACDARRTSERISDDGACAYRLPTGYICSNRPCRACSTQWQACSWSTETRTAACSSRRR